jgi:hypothetical protein
VKTLVNYFSVLMLAFSANCFAAGSDQDGVASQAWQAWIDVLGSQESLTVRGEVEVDGLGTEVLLAMRSPQGFNGEILQLDLYMIPQDGQNPEPIIFREVVFTRLAHVGTTPYTHVEVFYNDEPIAFIPVGKTIIAE